MHLLRKQWLNLRIKIYLFKYQRGKSLKKNINKQTETVADLQIGPTNQGMVRIYITSNSIDIPMDFSPEEARSIADELNASAVLAEKS